MKTHNFLLLMDAAGLVAKIGGQMARKRGADCDPTDAEIDALKRVIPEVAWYLGELLTDMDEDIDVDALFDAHYEAKGRAIAAGEDAEKCPTTQREEYFKEIGVKCVRPDFKDQATLALWLEALKKDYANGCDPIMGMKYGHYVVDMPTIVNNNEPTSQKELTEMQEMGSEQGRLLNNASVGEQVMTEKILEDFDRFTKELIPTFKLPGSWT